MGGGADSILGAGSAGSVLSKMTTGLAIAFMVSSIILVKYYGGGAFNKRETVSPATGSVMDEVPAPAADIEVSEQAPEEVPELPIDAPGAPEAEGEAVVVVPEAPVAAPEGAAEGAPAAAPAENAAAPAEAPPAAAGGQEAVPPAAGAEKPATGEESKEPE